MTEDTQLQEIVEWFDHRGYDLWWHEYAGAWRAPYLPKGARFGSADYGSGATALEAALDAQRRFEVAHPPRAVSASATMPLEAGGSAEVEAGEHRHVVSSDSGTATERAYVEQQSDQSIEEEIVTEQLLGYGWHLWFEPEPDGTLTAIVRADDTGNVLRTFTCEDHEDAFLQLGIELRPPSQEVRRAQQRRDPS